MEKKHFTRLKLKLLAFTAVASFAAWILGFLFYQLVIDGLFNHGLQRCFVWLAQNWAGLGEPQAQALYTACFTENKPIVLAVLLAVLMLIACYLSFGLFSRYLNQISAAAHGLFEPEGDPVRLPPELLPVQNDLEGIRRAAAAQRSLNRDSEQRKSDLIAYLAHDLKTPLTSALGYLELLDKNPDLPPEQRANYVGIALNKTRRLEKLLNEFFDISRMELTDSSRERVDIRLDLLLMQLTDEFYPLLAEKELRCHVDLQDSFTVNGNPDQLARTFDNLLRNAVNYSTPGTAIRVRGKVQTGWCEISITNEGLGIPEEQLSTIFQKFYRLDEARQTHTGGAGLGLAIAKEIVELHSGTIAAASTGKFTTFTVRLPCHA